MINHRLIDWKFNFTHLRKPTVTTLRAKTILICLNLRFSVPVSEFNQDLRIKRYSRGTLRPGYEKFQKPRFIQQKLVWTILSNNIILLTLFFCFLCICTIPGGNMYEHKLHKRVKTEYARRWSNKWTKILYQDYLHCVANFCRALLIIFSKQFISSNTKRRKRMLNFVWNT